MPGLKPGGNSRSSAPWIGLPGEFEPGAQRWVHYGCNVLGDPAIKIWISNPAAGLAPESLLLSLELSPVPAAELIRVSLTVEADTRCTLTISNSLGQILHYQAGVDCHPGKMYFRGMTGLHS